MNADGTNQRMLQLPKGSYYTPVWGPYPAGAGPAQAATAAPSTPPVPTPDPQAKQPGK